MDGAWQSSSRNRQSSKRWSKGEASSQQSDGSRPLLAMVALDKPSLPSATAMVAFLRAIPGIAFDLGSAQTKAIWRWLQRKKAIWVLYLPVLWAEKGLPIATMELWW